MRDLLFSHTRNETFNPTPLAICNRELFNFLFLFQLINRFGFYWPRLCMDRKMRARKKFLFVETKLTDLHLRIRQGKGSHIATLFENMLGAL